MAAWVTFNGEPLFSTVEQKFVVTLQNCLNLSSVVYPTLLHIHIYILYMYYIYVMQI